MTQLYVTQELGTNTIARKYKTDHASVSKRLRKMGIRSDLHQNWGGNRASKWLAKRGVKENIIADVDTTPRLCLLCIETVQIGELSKHLREEHELTGVWTDDFFIKEEDLSDRFGQFSTVSEEI
jgi:hypothetical protein